MILPRCLLLYQEIQLVLHVLEESTNHGSKVDDVGGLVLLEDGLGGRHVTGGSTKLALSCAYRNNLLSYRTLILCRSGWLSAMHIHKQCYNKVHLILSVRFPSI